MGNSLDVTIFNALYNFGMGNPLHATIIMWVAEYSLYLFLILGAIWLWRLYRLARMMKLAEYIFALVSALIVRFGVVSLIRMVYHHARPFVTLGVTPVFPETSYSFPSGHTAFFFALVGALWYVDRRAALAIAVLGIGVGCARVAAGVHWPSDIAGGILIGIVGGAFLYSVIHWMVYGQRP